MNKLCKAIFATVLAAFAVFLVGGTVFAADKNYYELNLYEKSSLADFSDADMEAYYWAIDIRGHYDWNDAEGAEYDYFPDGTLVATIHCTVDCDDDNNVLVDINSELAADDNQIFDFTEEEKIMIEQDFLNLVGYDGIIFRVASEVEPEPDCDSVCILSIKMAGATGESHEKTAASFDGLNINFDLFFDGQNESIEYKVTLYNGTDGDLKISASGGDDYIGYDVEMDNADFPAKSRKTLIVKVYPKRGIPSEMLSDDGTVLSTFIIELFDDNEANPSTFDSLWPFAIVIGSGALLLVALGKNKRGYRGAAMIVLLFGIVLLLPVRNTSASARYEVKINARVELSNKIKISFMANGDNVVEIGDRVWRVEPNEYLPLPSDIFERRGYRFASWNTEPDGTGDWYYNGDSAEYMFDEDIALYAHWDPAIYYSLTSDDSILKISDSEFDGVNWWDGPRPDGYRNIYLENDIEFRNRANNPFTYLWNHDCASNRLNSVTDVTIMGHIAPKNMSYLFYQIGCWPTSVNSHLSMDLRGLDTSNATTMSHMFSQVGSNLQGIGFYVTDWSLGDLSGWDVSNVTDMNSMFYRAGGDTSYWSVGDLSGWDVSNVTDMGQMFSYIGTRASTIELGDIKRWNVAKVENMFSMFENYGSQQLSNCVLNLNGWNTASLTNISRMFTTTCYNAENFSLDLRSFDMSKVTNMENMFAGTGTNATSWQVIIPATNGNGLTNTSTRMYGADETVYVDAPAGRNFTVAN